MILFEEFIGKKFSFVTINKIVRAEIATRTRLIKKVFLGIYDYPESASRIYLSAHYYIHKSYPPEVSIDFQPYLPLKIALNIDSKLKNVER